MTIEILIPTPLRSYTDNQKKVTLNALSVSDALENLVSEFPKLRNHLFEGEKLRNFVNIWLSPDTSPRPKTPVSDGDNLAIIPAIAGGLL